MKSSGMLVDESKREFSHDLGVLLLEFTQFNRSNYSFLVRL